MQVAYCLPCSEYSFCCPNWVPPPPMLTWPGGWGYPAEGYPHPDLAGGYPNWVPHQQGIPPPSRVPPPAGPGRVPPPPAGWLDLSGYSTLGVCPMAFWEMLQSIMGIWVSPPVDRQTDTCQNITFPVRTTYAGGNKVHIHRMSSIEHHSTCIRLILFRSP